MGSNTVSKTRSRGWKRYLYLLSAPSAISTGRAAAGPPCQQHRPGTACPVLQWEERLWDGVWSPSGLLLWLGKTDILTETQWWIQNEHVRVAFCQFSLTRLGVVLAVWRAAFSATLSKPSWGCPLTYSTSELPPDSALVTWGDFINAVTRLPGMNS